MTRSQTGAERFQRLASGLDALRRSTDYAKRIENDPVMFLHRFSEPRDIEIVGWIVSSLAYGQVAVFQAAIEKILGLMGGRPYDYVTRFDPAKDLRPFEELYYRLNSGSDIACLIFFIQQIISKHGSIGKFFSSLHRASEENIYGALERFVQYILTLNAKPIYGKDGFPGGLSQFFTPPSRGSACKRLNLYLRWMIRPNDGVDFGIWKGISPDKLIMPLDTHVFRISRYLGFTRRRSANWQAALEITNALKRINPHDPLSFDFALCHHGISGNCPIGKAPAKCEVCPLRAACAKGRQLLRLSGRSETSAVPG